MVLKIVKQHLCSEKKVISLVDNGDWWLILHARNQKILIVVLSLGDWTFASPALEPLTLDDCLNILKNQKSDDSILCSYDDHQVEFDGQQEITSQGHQTEDECA